MQTTLIKTSQGHMMTLSYLLVLWIELAKVITFYQVVYLELHYNLSAKLFINDAQYSAN